MTNEELDALNEALEYWEREDCIANTLDAREIFKAAQAYAKHHATIKAIESGKYVIAPSEPTEEMINAAKSRDAVLDGETMYHGIYKAMLSARPKIGGE